MGKPVQVAHVSGGRGNKSGVSDAARQLGLDRDDVRRVVKVASLSREAQDAAHKVGLADNRTALLEAAKLPEKEQAAYLADEMTPRHGKDRGAWRNPAAMA